MNLPGLSPENGMMSYDFARFSGQSSAGDIDFKKLAEQLDCSRDFFQAGIIYDDGAQRWLVRPSRRIANINQSSVSHVVVTRVKEVHKGHAEKSVVDSLSAPSLATEITSTAFACGGFLVMVFLTATASAATPFTAGATGVIAAIGVAGSAATAAQCLIGTGRLIAISNGHEKDVAWLDTQDWYIATTTALDVLSLAGAGAGLKSSLETYKIMKGISATKVADWFKGLTRAERKRLTEEIIRAQNPGISNTGIKAAMEAGRYPKRFPSESIQRQLQRELMIAVNNTVTFAGSAATGTIRNPQNLSKTGKYIVSTIQSFSF